MQFPQALVRREATGNFGIALGSPAFEPLWHSKVLAVCEAFAADPPETTLPAALFVQRLDRKHSLIIRSQPNARAKQGVVGFHVLVAPFDHYASLQFDPFALAERSSRTGLLLMTCLTWNGKPRCPGRRTVADVQKVLKRENGPELLGGCQALIDGSQLLFVRQNDDADVIRDLWMLLPYGNRLELMPATYAWNNKLKFDVAVAGPDKAANFAGYLTEEQAGGYPEGRYELSLQTAAEAEDQASLDVLWSRRSRREMWRIGILLLAVLAILAIAIKIMSPTPKP